MSSRYEIKLTISNSSADFEHVYEIPAKWEATLHTSEFIKGDKPVKGVDYWTNDDIRRIVNDTYWLLMPEFDKKQDALVSGITIKTVNNGTLLDRGNINLVESDDVKKIIRKTQDEYDNIPVKDENTLYIIVDNN